MTHDAGQLIYESGLFETVNRSEAVDLITDIVFEIFGPDSSGREDNGDPINTMLQLLDMIELSNEQRDRLVAYLQDGE